MKQRSPPLLLAPIAALTLACAAADDPTLHQPEAPAATAGAGGSAVCLQHATFVGSGTIQIPGAGTTAGANRIGAVRAERHEGCERIVVDLEAGEGDPAEHTGMVAAELLRDLGLLRVWLPDVQSVDPDATDVALAGPLAVVAYTTRRHDREGVYVDVHLGDAAEAFVSTLDDPARVVIDLRPGGSEVPVVAPREQLVVVLSPRARTAAYPLTVTGYARTFEANVVVRLESDGHPPIEDFTTAAGYLDAWGEYSLTIADGPAGPVVLHVGEYSAKDGAWQGVAIDLEMR